MERSIAEEEEERKRKGELGDGGEGLVKVEKEVKVEKTLGDEGADREEGELKVDEIGLGSAAVGEESVGGLQGKWDCCRFLSEFEILVFCQLCSTLFFYRFRRR